MRTFFAMALLTFALAFAGCEPAENNTGNNNAGNNGNSSGGDGTNTGDGSGTTDPGTDGNGDGTGSGTTSTGNWKVELWQAWLDNTGSNGLKNGNGTISGVTTLSAFCDWANTYFPDGIPKLPNGGEGAFGTSWKTYLQNNPNVAENFPTTTEQRTGYNRMWAFIGWADDNFWRDDDTMPNTPPADDSLEIVAGPWKLADWQRYRDSLDEGIGGITNMTNFINWANTNFPNGIPKLPEGKTGEAWDATAWSTWFASNTDKAFPSGNTWNTFREWAAEQYPNADMPNTPPASGSDGQVAAPPAPEAPETPAAPSTPGEIVDDMLGTTPTTDRSLEDAGMQEVRQ